MVTAITIYIWCKVPAIAPGPAKTFLGLMFLITIFLAISTDIGLSRLAWR